MTILNEVEKPSSDIDLYVTSLDKILIEKQNKIIAMRKKLYDFFSKLKDEEALSSKLSGLDDNKKDEEIKDENIANY